MKMFAVILLSVVVHGSLQSSLNHWSLSPHTVVVETNPGQGGVVNISCLHKTEALTTHNISWQKNGNDEKQTGNTYRIEVKEFIGGGNYTCHHGGAMLNYTTVLVSAKGEENRIIKAESNEYLHCAAVNYNGSFLCSWSWGQRVGRVFYFSALRRGSNDLQCSSDSVNQSCAPDESKITCSVAASGLELFCMEEQHLAFVEETKRVEVVIYFRSNSYVVESYSTRFYMYEKVRPGPVVYGPRNGTTVSWNYPRSWSKPDSFFPLEFQLAQAKKWYGRYTDPCGELAAVKVAQIVTMQCTDVCQFQVKLNAKIVCVRARDHIVHSNWGPWSLLRHNDTVSVTSLEV